jgi:mortality factor 4-like protein 1
MSPGRPPLEDVTNHFSQWDDWVLSDRIKKFTDENKDLAAALHTQMKSLQKGSKGPLKKKGGANGSDFSSARGSEERTASVAQSGRRRAREFDVEDVSTYS